MLSGTIKLAKNGGKGAIDPPGELPHIILIKIGYQNDFNDSVVYIYGSQLSQEKLLAGDDN